MRLLLLELDYFLDLNFGWFFTNGRKIESYQKRVENKKLQILNLKNAKRE